MISPRPGDPTPESGSETDVARVGRAEPKPSHEQTAEEDREIVDWDRIAATEEFRDLLHQKAKFVVPMTIFFVVYYFALPVLVGFYPDTMKTKIGPANLAYLFALSQFFVAWIIAVLYTRTAAKWDRQSADIVANAPKK